MPANPESPPSSPLLPGTDALREFADFVGAHYQAAYRFALGLSGNHDDACDLAQQAFFIAQTKGHQLRDGAKRKSWLFTVLHREFLNLRRRTAAHPQTPLEFAEPELPPIKVDLAAAIDSQSALAALQSLEESFKAPLCLFYLEQLSYKEIAAVLEVPIGTVMSRLARGKQMLRARLETPRQKQVANLLPLPGNAGGGPSDG